MARRRKSPFRFVCKRLSDLDDWPLDEEERYRCTGRCVRPLRVAQFRAHERRGSQYAVLHPSTKYHGNWQVSWFDERGPVYDYEATSCDDGLKQIFQDWPLARIDDKGVAHPEFVVEDWA